MSDPDLYEADQILVPDLYTVYSVENRQLVYAAILENNHDLRRRIEVGENSDSEGNHDHHEAEDELFRLGVRALNKNFESLSEAEKQRLQGKAIEIRNSHWRRYREVGRLIETEESLAQKAEEDEKRIVSGPIALGQAASGGSSSHQVTGTFISGQILTPVQELTPPFDRNTLKMKTGKIEAEEYF